MTPLALELKKNAERKNLEDHFRDVIEINPELERRLVSFQANKKEPLYRWFKYKEGFSSALIKYVVESLPIARHGNVMEIASLFSGPDKLREALLKLQNLLYSSN
ncbi:MAG: hypothetical protein HYU34_06090 [Candidatus Omnitrophica bacterium]|nr:hypothetical protein [Candidatus Omnitrophota bacterium]